MASRAIAVLMFSYSDRYIQEFFIENRYPVSRNGSQGLRIPAVHGRKTQLN